VLHEKMEQITNVCFLTKVVATAEALSFFYHDAF
jgi:hypothetical protein